jgi:peptidoglycan/xylan/chitin deacetylase (PgdA/CDA1 family)
MGNGRPASILMYHAVAQLDHDPNMLCVSPQLFDAQMRYLKRRNMRGVSIRELLRAASSGTTRGLIGLTFDDGYENFLQTAVPVLERYGFSATVFVVTDLLGQENDWVHLYERPRMKLLGAEGAREVLRRGMEVGSHSASHPRLSGLEPGWLEKEVSGSRQALSEVLSEAVEGFCYPYGDVDSAAVEAVRRSGYAYACAWKTRPEGKDYDLPRIPMSEKDGLFRLKTKLRIYSQYAKITRSFRS